MNAQTAVPNVHVPFEFAAGNSVAILAIKRSPGTITGMAKLMFERKGGELFLSALELPDQTFNLPVQLVRLRPRLARLR